MSRKNVVLENDANNRYRLRNHRVDIALSSKHVVCWRRSRVFLFSVRHVIVLLVPFSVAASSFDKAIVSLRIGEGIPPIFSEA